MKGKRDSCGHEDSLRVLLDALFRAQQRPDRAGWARRKRTFRKYADNLSLSFSPRHCWWKFERFYSVARFTSHRFPVSPSFLSGEFYESVYPRNVVRKFSRSPMNIGRSINFKTSDQVRRSVCRRVTSSLTFGTLDSSDVIITELSPKRRDCHRRTKFNRRFTSPCPRTPGPRESILRTSSINVLYDRKVSLRATTYFSFPFFYERVQFIYYV